MKINKLKGNIRIFIRRSFLAVNILFALALLISYLAVHINPADFFLPAFFGLAYPYLLLCNIIIVIIWAVNLRWEAMISVVIIAVGFTHFSNYIKLRKPKKEHEGTFSVMSYNLRLFNIFEDKGSTGAENKILKFISSNQPSVLCMQELYIKGEPAIKDREIKKALGGGYFSHIKMIGSGKGRYYGIGTYSRYPIINKGEIKHPASSSLSIYTDVVIEKDTFRIFNNHLQSFRLQTIEESFMEELLGPENKQLIDDIKNISRRLKRGFARRALQAQVVKDYINLSPYPVIVAGDFNDTPVSYAYRKIRKGLNDSFVSSGHGAGFTYRGNYPPNRIDYILYDNRLVSTFFDIPRVRYSDHYPVIAWFRKP